jgi:hypothetical protein
MFPASSPSWGSRPELPRRATLFASVSFRGGAVPLVPYREPSLSPSCCPRTRNDAFSRCALWVIRAACVYGSHSRATIGTYPKFASHLSAGSHRRHRYAHRRRHSAPWRRRAAGLPDSPPRDSQWDRDPAGSGDELGDSRPESPQPSGCRPSPARRRWIGQGIERISGNRHGSSPAGTCCMCLPRC